MLDTRGRGRARVQLKGYHSTSLSSGQHLSTCLSSPARQRDRLFQPHLPYLGAGVLYGEGLEAFFRLVQQNRQDP